MHQSIPKHFIPYLYELATVPLVYVLHLSLPAHYHQRIWSCLHISFNPAGSCTLLPPNQKTTIKLCKQLHWFVGAHELVFRREQKALNTWPGRDPIEMPHLITRKSGNFTTTFGNSIQSGHTSPAREVYVTQCQPECLSFMYPGIVSQAIDAAVVTLNKVQENCVLRPKLLVPAPFPPPFRQKPRLDNRTTCMRDAYASA